MKSEIKKNIQGTNSERKVTRTQTNNLEQKEEINIQPEQNEEETRFKKMRRHLGTPGTTLNTPVSGIIEVSEEEKQEIENLFEKIMKENFPNLGKK